MALPASMQLTHVPVQQPMAAASLKRSYPSPGDVEPQRSPMRVLPVVVLEDHLLPLLTREDAARLGCTRKELRAMVREHFQGIGTVKLKTLQAALTTFPRARNVTLEDFHYDPWEMNKRRSCCSAFARERVRGRYLENVTIGNLSHPARDFVHKALREGVLPSLKRVEADLCCEIDRASLTDDILGAVHELRLSMDCRPSYNYVGDVEPRLTALGLVRQLRALTELEVYVEGVVQDPLEWPPFIPPSLTRLRIDDSNPDDYNTGNVASDSLLLCSLPGITGISGARLERLEVLTPYEFGLLGDALVHLAQALRCCSPTLRGFLLSTQCGATRGDDDDELERLPVQ
jgi:hypothetical protein